MDQSRIRILVVDDEPAIRLTLQLLLEQEGYAVTTAADGTTALGFIEQGSFDLLLLDLKLPGMTGLELAWAATTCQPEAAVILLTGSNDFVPLSDSPLPPAVTMIHKTVSPVLVLDQVGALLQRG